MAHSFINPPLVLLCLASPCLTIPMALRYKIDRLDINYCCIYTSALTSHIASIFSISDTGTGDSHSKI